MRGHNRLWRLWWVRVLKGGKGGFDLWSINVGRVAASYFMRSRVWVVGKHGKWWVGGWVRGG